MYYFSIYFLHDLLNNTYLHTFLSIQYETGDLDTNLILKPGLLLCTCLSVNLLPVFVLRKLFVCIFLYFLITSSWIWSCCPTHNRVGRGNLRNLGLKPFVPIKTLRHFPYLFSTEFWRYSYCVLSRGKEHFEYFIFLSGNRTHILLRLKTHAYKLAALIFLLNMLSVRGKYHDSYKTFLNK